MLILSLSLWSCRLETAPGEGSGPHHPARPTAAPNPGVPPEPPPGALPVPGPHSHTHTRTHTSTQLHQDDGNNNFAVFLFFFFFFLYQAVKKKKKKNTPIITTCELRVFLLPESSLNLTPKLANVDKKYHQFSGFCFSRESLGQGYQGISYSN